MLGKFVIHVGKSEIGSLLIPYAIMNWLFKNLSIKDKTLKILEENIGQFMKF